MRSRLFGSAIRLWDRDHKQPAITSAEFQTALYDLARFSCNGRGLDVRIKSAHGVASTTGRLLKPFEGFYRA